MERKHHELKQLIRSSLNCVDNVFQMMHRYQESRVVKLIWKGTYICALVNVWLFYSLTAYGEDDEDLPAKNSVLPKKLSPFPLEKSILRRIKSTGDFFEAKSFFYSENVVYATGTTYRLRTESNIVNCNLFLFHADVIDQKGTVPLDNLHFENHFVCKTISKQILINITTRSYQG